MVNNKNECKIIIDTHETKVIQSMIHTLSNKFNRTNIDIKHLIVGDYLIISPNKNIEIVIERKTINDLVSSMIDGRTNVQISELLEQDNGVLVIVGNPYQPKYWERTNFKIPDSVTRYLTGLSLKRNLINNKLTLIQIPSHDQLATMIDYIAKTIENNKLIRIEDGTTRKFKLNRKTKQNEMDIINSTRLSQLASIDKCGVKKATNVMNYFKWDYKKIQNAPIEKLRLVDGIGKILAERIYKVYNE